MDANQSVAKGLSKGSPPKFPKKLPGSFWGMTTFFNPCGYNIKLENYRRFRKANKKQGLKLLCVELAFDDADFELREGDADILIQLRTSSVLWQKERLLNVGLKHLPKDCDKIAWLDADIIFYNDNWVEQTCKLLESYKVVQPFSFAVRQTKGVHSISFDKLPSGNVKNQKRHSMVYGIIQFGKELPPSDYIEKGFSGLAWAIRRHIFDKHGFYDRHILGSGDTLIGRSFYGDKTSKVWCYGSKRMKIEFDRWLEEIYQEVSGSVHYVDGEVLHLWHGRRKNRDYLRRQAILKKYDFDPHKDIKIDENGCWVWATDKPEMHKRVRRYFWMRNEDGSLLRAFYCHYYKFIWRIILFRDRLL